MENKPVKAQKDRPKLSRKELEELQTAGPIRLDNLLSEIANAPRATTIGPKSLVNLSALKQQALVLNIRLATYVPAYQSREPEILSGHSASHKECCSRLNQQILDLLSNGDVDKAEMLWLRIDAELEHQERAALVSALAVKYSEMLSDCEYPTLIMADTFLMNNSVKTELPKDRYAELVDRLVTATLAQSEANARERVKKLEFMESIQKNHGSEMAQSTRIKISASHSNLEDGVSFKIFTLEAFNKNGLSIREFNRALNGKLISAFAPPASHRAKVEKLPENLSIQCFGARQFETLGECLKAAKPVPGIDRTILLVTEVKSIKVEKEPKDRETVRIERFSGEKSLASLGEAFQMGLAGSGKLSHFECEKETQKVQITAVVEFAFYDMGSGKILMRDTVEPDQNFVSIQMSKLMAVGQDTVGERAAGPLKQVPVSSGAPNHVQRVMAQSTDPLPSNSTMTQEILQKSASMIWA